MVCVRTLAYNLVLRVVLLVRLYLTDHRYVVLHANVVVNIDLVMVAFVVLPTATYIGSLLIYEVDVSLRLTFFFREVEIGRSYELVHGTVRTVVVVVVKCRGTRAPIPTHQ